MDIIAPDISMVIGTVEVHERTERMDISSMTQI